jgi:hypothetical protein
MGVELGSRALAVRIAVSAAVVAGLQAGPVARQLLALPNPPLTMSWSMYSGVGRDLCIARWQGADGARIDRRQALGLPPPAEASPSERFLRSPAAVRQAARPLCEALPGAGVRAEAWCAGADGRWIRAVDPSELLCPR